MSSQLSREQLTDEEEFFHLNGDQAREYNISAARGVVEAVRTTYGPKGLDKMLVTSAGSVDVTNDGVTVLNGLEIEHPAAKILVEAARTQRDEVGDGTTTAVLFAGTFLREAEELLDMGIHPAVIIDGFQLALDRALGHTDELAEHVDVTDDETLWRVATTSLSGKSIEPRIADILPLLIETVRSIEVDGYVDFEYLDIETQVGRAITASTLIEGAILDGGPCRETMPYEMTNTDALLLDEPLQPEETELEVRAEFESHDRQAEFLDQEIEHVQQLIERIDDLDPGVVLCRHRISDYAQQLLADRNIFAVDNIEQSDVSFEFLREVLNASVVTDLEQATASDLGHGSVRYDRPAECIYVENKSTHGASLVLRGSGEHVVDEVERSVKNTLDVLARTISDGRVTAGGGAVEVEIAMRLREYADSISGPQQLAVRAFASALEAIPNALATNAGHDPIDTLIELRNAHAADSPRSGLRVADGTVVDAFEAGIVEPTYVKEQAMLSAMHATNLILKIDGVISAEKISAGNREE